MLYREIIAVCSEIHTNFMQLSPFWEANISSAGQEIPRILRKTNVHYSIHKNSPPLPILTQPNQVHVPHPTSQRSILILSFHLNQVFQEASFSTKVLYAPLFYPYMLHAPPISFYSSWSPEQYLVRSTDHSAPHYVVFSTPLSPRSIYAQISSPAPYSRTPSTYDSPSLWETKFHTRRK